jgi:F-type H+-transporting ATPase subunit d
LVDDFQKRYEALQIPFPKDTLSATIEQQGVQQKADYETFVKNSKARIVDINADLAKWEAMMPVEEMNLEEALEYVPHMLGYNPNKPSLWPHDESVEDFKEKLKKMDPNDDHH